MIINLEHFKARLLQDALTEATAQHWQHRADTFANVGTPECDQIALACHNHAALLRSLAPQPISEEVQAVLEETA